jgi:hypothetical protein
VRTCAEDLGAKDRARQLDAQVAEVRPPGQRGSCGVRVHELADTAGEQDDRIVDAGRPAEGQLLVHAPAAGGEEGSVTEGNGLQRAGVETHDGVQLGLGQLVTGAALDP